MLKSTPHIVTLSGHLTSDVLLRELTRIEPALRTSCKSLIIDTLAMTGYEESARDLFVSWNARNRSRIARVAVVTDKLLWRMVISAMSLASGQEMKPFLRYEEALAWALNPGRADESFSIQLQVGRLVELRVGRISMSELPQFIRTVTEVRGRTIGEGVVAIADLRALKALPPEIMKRGVVAMQRRNLGIVRVALLCSAGRTAMHAQLEQMLKAGDNPNRRLFNHPAQAEDWLGEVLTEPERTRLATFIRER